MPLLQHAMPLFESSDSRGPRGAGAGGAGGVELRSRKRRRVEPNPFGGSLTHVWRWLTPIFSALEGIHRSTSVNCGCASSSLLFVYGRSGEPSTRGGGLPATVKCFMGDLLVNDLT